MSLFTSQSVVKFYDKLFSVLDLSFPAPIQDAEECTFLADKGYDVKAIYNLIRDAYHGEAVILLNKRGTKNPKLLSCGNPI